MDELILENNNLPSLPGHVFASLRVLRLMLRNNRLERVSSGWLEGLHDSLLELFLVEPDLRSLPIDSLENLQGLEAVTLQSKLMKRLPSFSGTGVAFFFFLLKICLIYFQSHIRSPRRSLEAPLSADQFSGSAGADAAKLSRPAISRAAARLRQSKTGSARSWSFAGLAALAADQRQRLRSPLDASSCSHQPSRAQRDRVRWKRYTRCHDGGQSPDGSAIGFGASAGQKQNHQTGRRLVRGSAHSGETIGQP